MNVLTAGLIGFLCVSALFDLRSGFLPDACTAVIAVLAFVLALLSHTLVSSLLGSLLAFSFFAMQQILSNGKAVGTGDIFLACALGLWLGLRGTMLMLLWAYAIGAVLIGTLLLLNIISFKRKHIPFGPFLAAGAIVSHFMHF